MSEDTSNVVNLSGEPVTLVKRQDDYCTGHCKNVLVDMHLRKLTCRECGADVEPFQWVSRMALTESSLSMRVQTLHTAVAELEMRVTALKEEETRVKARVRTAKESLLKSAGI